MTHPSPHEQNAIYRKGRTPEFYKNFVIQYPSSGLTLQKYCKLHHVAPNTFRFYKKEIEAPSPSLSTPPSPRIVELIPIVESSSPGKPSPFQNVHTPVHTTPSSPFEIKFPNGIVLHLHYLDPTLLESLFTISPRPS